MHVHFAIFIASPPPTITTTMISLILTSLAARFLLPHHATNLMVKTSTSTGPSLNLSPALAPTFHLSNNFAVTFSGANMSEFTSSCAGKILEIPLTFSYFLRACTLSAAYSL